MPRKPVEIKDHKPAIADLNRVQAQIQNGKPIDPEVLLKTGVDRLALRQYAASALSGMMTRVGINLARSEVAACFEIAKEMLNEEQVFIHKESLR